MKQKGPKLILHFDLSKTIILEDSAMGFTKETMVSIIDLLML
jgi:hypothetical protein